MFVFGGLDENQMAKSDLYVLDIGNMVWKYLGAFRIDGEEMKVCGHSAAAYEEKILVFGGLDPQVGTIYNQVFVLNTEGKQWGKIEKSKSPRFCGNIVVCGGNILITGGCNLVNRTVPATEKVLFEEISN